MRPLSFLLCAALLPASAFAGDRCDNAQPRNLALDLKGAKVVVFEIGSDDLVVEGGNGAAAVTGRACASNAGDLSGLTVSQRREGDKLVVVAEHAKRLGLNFNGQYHLQLHASVPRDLRVQLKVGSGDAAVKDVAALSADVNSGDIQVANVRGLTVASVGSGDIGLRDIGPLQIVSLGSGDLKARNVGGDVKIGTVGSGDVELDQVAGSVTLERIGSGDLEVDGVRGDLRVARVGSGSVRHRGVAGKVDVPKDD